MPLQQHYALRRGYRRRAGPRCSSAGRARRGSDPTARVRTGRDRGRRAVAGVAEILGRSYLGPAPLAHAAQKRELAAGAHHDLGRGARLLWSVHLRVCRVPSR